MESKFVELVRGWLVSLPHDLKIAFDAMDDENLPRTVREIATGVAIYVVSPNDSVGADRNDKVVSYADDAIFVSPNGVTKGRQAVLERYQKRYPDKKAASGHTLLVLHKKGDKWFIVQDASM